MFEFEVALAKRVIVFAKFTTGVFHSIRGNFSILNSARMKIRQSFSFLKTGRNCPKNIVRNFQRNHLSISVFQDRVLFGGENVGEQLEISSRRSSDSNEILMPDPRGSLLAYFTI